jgi:hypothetical protein
MRRLMLIALSFWFSASAALAQTAQTASPFRLDRTAEDWSTLSDDANYTRPWHGLKWIKSGPSSHVSIGGDFRLRTEIVDRPLFGATGARSDTYTLQRALLHVDAVVNPQLRFFGQFGYHEAFGRDGSFPLDKSGLDWSQAFVEVSNGSKTANAGVRIGRQEIALSPRFVGTRDSVNVRSNYDGVRGWIQNGPWRLEGFASRPVTIRAGSFDDRADQTQRFDGVRVFYTLPKHPTWRVIGGIYQIDRAIARVGSGSGRDQRMNWAGRLSGTSGPWDVELEGVVQSGKLGNRDIRAWASAAEIGYSMLQTPMQPRIGVRWLLASGDKNPNDSRVGTFVGFVTRPICCADPLWLAPSNYLAVAPTLRVNASKTIVLEGKIDFIWRSSRQDAIYAFPLIPYPRTANAKGGDLISTAPTVSLTWTPVPEFAFSLQHAEQSALGALKASGAVDSSFTYSSFAFRF